MVRTHTLVEYRLKEYELERALRSLKKQQEELDYKLDVEFYLKLEALTKDFGYSFRQVYELLHARYLGATGGTDDYADELKARTNTGLLEIIQRLERLPCSTSVVSKNPSEAFLNRPSEQNKESLESSREQFLKDEPGSISGGEVRGDQQRVEEKVDD